MSSTSRPAVTVRAIDMPTILDLTHGPIVHGWCSLVRQDWRTHGEEWLDHLIANVRSQWTGFRAKGGSLGGLYSPRNYEYHLWDEQEDATSRLPTGIVVRLHLSKRQD